MRLVTLQSGGRGLPGAELASGEFVEFASAARKGSLETWIPATVREILEGGVDALALVSALVARVEAMDGAAIDELRAVGAIRPADAPLLAPVPEPRLIVAAGLAYHSHLEEMAGTPAPPHPTAFMKSGNSVAGPSERLRLPGQASEQVDFEGELAVVFGRSCHAVSEEDALSYVAGYTIANDFSARDWAPAVWTAKQPWEARLTWEVNIMGKQMPGFTALGPVLVTADEVPDVRALRLSTTVNGAVMQDQPVSDLIFPIESMIAWFSRWYEFRAGDVLLTGTPAGVGIGRDPKVYMRSGDEVVVTIDRIGSLRTLVA